MRPNSHVPATSTSHVSTDSEERFVGIENVAHLAAGGETPQQRAGNICFAIDRWAATEAQLRANGIVTWGDAGRLRISVHAYNDPADVARVLDELARI
jgi:selenocysteine lyase/cysteine desulfurase